MNLDFEKIMLQVSRHGHNKKIVFKNKLLNWVIMRIGWINLCRADSNNFSYYEKRFDSLMKLGKEGNKACDCAYVPDFDVYETKEI